MTQHETILEALKNQPLNRARIRQLISVDDVQAMRLLNSLCESSQIYRNTDGKYALRGQAPSPETAA
jgi:predicted transcriptional regulator